MAVIIMMTMIQNRCFGSSLVPWLLDISLGYVGMWPAFHSCFVSGWQSPFTYASVDESD